MLNKTFLLATLFLFCVTSISTSTAKSRWQKVEIAARLHDDTFMTKQRQNLKLVGVMVPTAQNITPQNQCFAKNLQRLLERKVVGQSVKIKTLSEKNPKTAYLKFADNQDLSAFLLEQGWAQVDKSEHKQAKWYQDLQRQAQAQKRGLWGECDNWYKLREKQRIRGKTPYFKKAFKSYLAPVSTGWVQQIADNGDLVLSNGLQVRWQGVRLPPQNSEVFTCWHQHFKAQLKTKLVGKKVRLEADQLQLTDRKPRLQRYVWLEGNRFTPDLFLNAWLITEGWSQLAPEDLNLKHIETMQDSHEKWQNSPTPPSWWQHCAVDLVKTQQASVEQEKDKPSLVYDPKCRIKGNIAGSKKNPKKTYHTPLSGWYKRIEYEQCFANESEADAAGFEKVK